MFIALILAPLAIATPPRVAPVKPMCRNARANEAVVRGKPVRPHSLGSEPPAKHYYTVLRSVEGCQNPVLASTGEIGNKPPGKIRPR